MVGKAHFSGPQTAVLLLAFTLVAVIPVLAHPLPPLADYMNHLARMHVIATIDSDPDLSRYYEIEWQVIPNLMMDMVVPVFQRVMNIYHAGQLFTVITFVVIISGTLALNCALFGYWSVLPLVGFPLVYNRIFLVGVINYVFGIGLSLWGLAVWVWLRERVWPVRLIASILVVLVLFFCHLFAVGLYGLGLLAIELWRLWARRGQPFLPRIFDFIVTGLPFLSIVPLLLMSPTWQLSGENYWYRQGKFEGLYSVIGTYSDVIDIALAVTAAMAVAWAVRHRVLRLHPMGWMILGVGGIVYFAMPSVMFATYMADERLPIALVFMIIGCTNLKLRYGLVRRGFLALLLVLLVVRVIEVDVNWSDLSRETLAVQKSVERIVQRGSRVLVAQSDPTGGNEVRDFGLAHAACLAIIERSALVTTAFTISGKQIMRVRPAYRNQAETGDGDLPSLEQLLLATAPSLPAPVQRNPPYWQQWQNRFDYVYVLFTEGDAANPAPELLRLIHDGGRFQLYKINKRRSALE